MFFSLQHFHEKKFIFLFVFFFEDFLKQICVWKSEKIMHSIWDFSAPRLMNPRMQLQSNWSHIFTPKSQHFEKLLTCVHFYSWIRMGILGYFMVEFEMICQSKICFVIDQCLFSGFDISQLHTSMSYQAYNISIECDL